MQSQISVNNRSKTFSRLIEYYEAWDWRHQRAADRHHLLFAAAQFITGAIELSS